MTYGQHPAWHNNNVREVNANQISKNLNKIFEQMKVEIPRVQAIQMEQADKIT